MSNRTDPHRPGAIIPADYDYLFSYSGHGPEPWGSFNFTDKDAGPLSARSFLGTGKLFRESLQNCHSCGAHFRHGDLWRHRPSGKIIAIGHICADKYSLIADRTDFERAKAVEVLKAEREQERKAAENRRQKALAENDGLFDALNTDHHICKDIKGRFEEHGYISQAQIGLVMKLYRQDQERKMESVDHRTCPEGRQTVTGTIVSAKFKESPWGTQAKMTVKVPHDGGHFLVWSTVPAHIADDSRFFELKKLVGHTVTFTATIERSNKDRHFGFAKRPSKAKITDLDKADRKAEETAGTAV